MKKILFFLISVGAVIAVHAQDRVAIFSFVAEVTQPDTRGGNITESFVVEVNDAALAAEVRLLIDRKSLKTWPSFEIAAGTAGRATQNKNYSDLSHRLWSWHVVGLKSLQDTSNIRLDGSSPTISSLPSQIEADPAAWIAKNGNVYSPFAIFKYEFQPGIASYLMNESCRGIAGTGERMLICGFIIKGAEPQQVIIRGLGATLTRYGLKNVVGDPLLKLFKGNTEIARNDDWSTTPAATLQALDPFYTDMQPKDSLLVITLPPGPYTAQLDARDGPEGVALLEIYDAEPR